MARALLTLHGIEIGLEMGRYPCSCMLVSGHALHVVNVLDSVMYGCSLRGKSRAASDLGQPVLALLLVQAL